MTRKKVEEIPHWYVLRTNPRQEDRAASNLQAWGVETLNPKFRHECYDQGAGRPTYRISCLFPRYIFARFNVNSLLHKIRFTRGVHSLVSFGGCPAAVDRDVLDIIRHRIGHDGFIRIGGEAKPGDEVMIKHGRFKNLIGIFEREIGDSDRVLILLTTITYQARVAIDKGLIEKLSHA